MVGLKKALLLAVFSAGSLLATPFKNIPAYKSFTYPPDLYPFSVQAVGGQGATGYILTEKDKKYSAESVSSTRVSCVFPFISNYNPGSSFYLLFEKDFLAHLQKASSERPRFGFLDELLQNASAGLGYKRLIFRNAPILPALSCKCALTFDYINAAQSREMYDPNAPMLASPDQVRFHSVTGLYALGGNYFQFNGSSALNFASWIAPNTEILPIKKAISKVLLTHWGIDLFLPRFSFLKICGKKTFSWQFKQKEGSQNQSSLVTFDDQFEQYRVGFNITPLPWLSISGLIPCSGFSGFTEFQNALKNALRIEFKLCGHNTLSIMRWMKPTWVNALNSLPARHLEPIPAYRLLQLRANTWRDHRIDIMLKLRKQAEEIEQLKQKI